LANPVAQSTGASHSPRRGASPADALGTAETTQNWSGVDEVYSYPFFALSNNGYGSIVNGGWAQPTIGYENCAYGPYKTWTWVGMDGSGDALLGNNDVLQAGTAAEACPTMNYAWYEWWTAGCNPAIDTASYPCKAWMINLPLQSANLPQPALESE
jgi:hypothetical protein